MSKFNKSYRIRTKVGEDTKLHVNLNRDYDMLEIMSLKINHKNAYKLHTSNYGVIAGRVLANDAVGVPNAKISVFISININDSEDVIKSVLYPYSSTSTQDGDGVRYNLLPNEQVNNCHTIIGTFPEKQYLLDNGDLLEIFEDYYKFTTRTNESGDYMIFGVPTGSQTLHMDLDLSDIGILSQKPRDMVYKGYNIEQFENPNKFKYETNLENLTQVISQDTTTDVIPFWGDKDEGSIGITRCDIKVQYKFEPTCVFMGSIVSDTKSNGISKKCIPTPLMGAMDELTTGSGTIEMIRKTPSGDVEEFQIKGTQLINGDGVWCYQIPMNLDYVMTDEYGNMVPTNNPEKGIPTRTRVRFRMSMQEFDNNNTNIALVKFLVPHNPNIYDNNVCDDELDYQFGTNTKESSYRDLFWNGVYTIKSYIPRIQKGSNWKHEKFTGFKRVNYYGDKNPIPYNNIRIRIPFIFTIMCALIKGYIGTIKFLNKCFSFVGASFVQQEDDDGNRLSGSFISLSGEMCNENLDYLCILPGVNVKKIAKKNKKRKTTLLGMAIIAHYEDMGGTVDHAAYSEDIDKSNDTKSIDYNNKEENRVDALYQSEWESTGGKSKQDAYSTLGIPQVIVTNSTDYLIECIEMNLAQEYRVVQFDFYNDWINGLLYIPRWIRKVKKNGKVKACNENFHSGRNIVQQCSLTYDEDYKVTNYIGCQSKKSRCHKSSNVRKKYNIFKSTGLVKSFKNAKGVFIYYVKPYERSGSKNVRLFATDIVLLGSLNNCDKWGIPNDLKDLVSSTYQMPPNLALSDSEIEGNEYESKTNDNTHIYFTYWASAKCTDFDSELNGRYSSIGPMPDTGNYTEIAGVNWNYNGPLQLGNANDFFNPGGHFLGLTCRNSSTTIKTCVNLSRICEYGVWMSQRHDLTIPDDNEDNYIDTYATVPSGLISKDELSDTNYRRLFATMNHNGLKTVLNPETGYLKYDFSYINPTNFGGDLNSQVFDDNNMNRSISDTVTEVTWDINDDDYYNISSASTLLVKEEQIMRTGEYRDDEYLKFRFGGDFKNNNCFLYNDNSLYNFPMFNNSFYFYFGLHDGKTAIDEFKKQFYSVCEKNGDLTIIDDNVTLDNLTTVFCGVGEDIKNGEVSFNIKAPNELFDGKTTIQIDEDITNIITAETKGETITFTNLNSGTHYITILREGQEILYTPILIENVKIKGEIISNSFFQDMTNRNMNETITINNHGGYFEFKNNKITYEDESGTTELDITSSIINSVSVDCETSSAAWTQTFTGITSSKFQIMVPDLSSVKQDDYEVSFTVYVTTNMDNGKLTKSTKDTGYLSNNEHKWKIGEGHIYNGINLILNLGGISIENIKNVKDFNLPYKQTSGATTGWWDGILSSTEQDEIIKWGVKNITFFNDISDNYSHTIQTTITGGKSPYTTTLYGQDNSGNTIKGQDNSEGIINDLSFLTDITVPTINYKKGDNKRRPNFGLKIKDVCEKTIPNDKNNVITLPVIYKPFFTEMCLFYFDDTDQYYLYGNIYNGKTWDINEGFNAITLNNVAVNNFCVVGKEDNTFEFSEYLPTKSDGRTIQDINTDNSGITFEKFVVKTNKDGNNFMGISEDVPYFQYNGRKVSGQRELDGTVYGLNTARVLSNFNLSIKSEHIDEGGTYSDSTTVSMKDGRLFNFISSGETFTSIIGSNSNGYRIKLIPAVDLGDNYVMKLIDDDIFPYPKIDKNGVQIDDRLFRYLMCDYKNISNYTTRKNNEWGIPIIKNDDDYISTNNSDISGKRFYYIIMPKLNKNELIKKTSNSNNRIKPISFSSLINVNSLTRFYPFDISSNSIIKVNESNQSVYIRIESYCGNFKNKTLKIKLYKTESMDNTDNTENTENVSRIMFYNFEIETRNNENSVSKYFNSDFELFPKNNEIKSLYYECDWYIGDTKSPSLISGDIEYEYTSNQGIINVN